MQGHTAGTQEVHRKSQYSPEHRTMNSRKMRGVLPSTIIKFLMIPEALGINVIGYDCTDRSAQLTTYASKEVQPCETTASNLTTTNLHIQVLQMRIFEPVHIQHCMIKTLSIMQYCGLMSFTAAVENGISRNILTLTNQECRKIHTQGIFQYAGHTITQIKANSTRNIDLIEQGSVDKDGNCYGINLNTKQGNYKNVIVSTTLELSISDYISVYSTQRREIILSNGDACNTKEDSCFNPIKGTTIWNFQLPNKCDKNSKDIIFEGMAQITSSQVNKTTPIMRGDVVSINSREHLFAMEISEIEHLCFQTIYKSEVERLIVVVKNPAYGFYFQKGNDLLERNTDLSIYFNVKISHIGRKFQDDII